MAISVSIDQLTTLETQERHGALRRMVRECYVSGITDTDWQALTNALDNAGVPQYGDHLTNDTDSNAYDLMLVERSIRMTDKGQARVELVYENWIDLEENLDTPRGGFVIGEVRCNIQQKTSNLDINGNLVTVSHTYDANDPNHANETLTQGGEFSFYDVERTIFIRGIKQTRTPWLIANSIIGKVNSVAFSSEQPRTWLCTSCSWKMAWAGRKNGGGSRENRYFMNFEFQFNPDTWDPTVTFIDDVTGKPPSDLVENVGYKTVTKMSAVDFNIIIGSPLQGG